MKKILFLLLFTIAFLPQCGSGDEKGCPDKTCNDYTTQAQAQTAFDADADCLGELDDDNDGIACEHLSGGTGTPSGCPTTANCGCSNKNQGQCGGPCCQWIVGTGCKCK